METYDMVNKKLKNVGEGTASSDAITKHQLDTAMIDKHDNNQNIDLENTYNVINSKKRTKTQLDRNKPSIVSYDEVRDNFLSRREALAMDSFINMDGHTIQHLPLPVISHQVTNKQYVDSALSVLLSLKMLQDKFFTS